MDEYYKQMAAYDAHQAIANGRTLTEYSEWLAKAVKDHKQLIEILAETSRQYGIQ